MFDHPASPFVMNFLGNVNIFHGRVEQGRALLGPLALDYPGALCADPGRPPAMRDPTSWKSREPIPEADYGQSSRRQMSPGPSCGLELLAEDRLRAAGGSCAREQHEDAGAKIGERLYVRPRKIRVFVGADGAERCELSSILQFFRSVSPGQGHKERRSFLELALGPHSASVPQHDSLHVRQADAGALELFGAMQPLEDPEQPVGIGHVEANPVVAHEHHRLGRRTVGRTTDFDPARPRDCAST